MSGIRGWTVLMCVGVIAGCGAAADHDADGRGGPQWSTGPVPVVSVGEVDGDPAYLFSRIASVRLLPDHRFVVADRASGTLRVFASEGTLERQMGGLGEGPGEFQYIGALQVRPPDTLVVYDSGAQRLTTFLVGGELLTTVSLQASTGFPEMYLGRFRDGSHALAWIDQGARGTDPVTPDRMRIGRFAASGKDMGILAEGVGMRRSRIPSGPLPFSPHSLAVAVADTVFHTDGPGGALHGTAAQDGAPLTRSLSIAPLSIDAAWAQIESQVDSSSIERFREVQGLAATDSIPTLSDLLVDGRGRVWAKRYAPATDSHWIGRRRTGGEWVLALDPSGAQARLQVPDRVRLMDVGAERIIGVAVDDLGVERVQQFTIRPEQPRPAGSRLPAR